MISCVLATCDTPDEEVPQEEQYNSEDHEVAHDLAVGGGLFVHLLDSSETASEKSPCCVEHVTLEWGEGRVRDEGECEGEWG